MLPKIELERLATEGNEIAEYQLGSLIYEEGRSSEAISLLMKGHKAGRHLSSMRLIRILQMEGEGQNAFELANELCQRGYSPGCFRLGRLYEDGIGCTADEAAAKHAFEKAAHSGHYFARKRLIYLNFIKGKSIFSRLYGRAMVAALIIRNMRAISQHLESPNERMMT